MPPYSRSRLRYRRKHASYFRFRLRYQRKKASYSTSPRIRKEGSSCLSGKEVSKTLNWVDDLPRDVLVAILQKVGSIDILLNVQKVCVLWRKICQDPVIWKSIDIHNIGKLCNLPDFLVTIPDLPYDVEKMTEVAIDRSCGQLININLEYIGNDHILKYITDRKIQLKRLRIVLCYITDEGLSEAAKKMPFMEELHIIFGNIKHVGLENVGRSCPGLKSLTYTKPSKLNKFRNNEEDSYDEISFSEFEEYDHLIHPNSVAIAISKTMPELQHLNLIGNGMTNEGLQAILDSCPRLESLDLRNCFRLDLGSDPELSKRCSSIKTFRHPNDYINRGDVDVPSYDDSDFYLLDNDNEDW